MALSADDLRAIALDVAATDPHRQQEVQRTLRVALAPERPGEVIDPRRLDEEAFHHAVMVAAQDPAHRLVAYGQPVRPKVSGQALMIERTDPQQDWREERTGRIEVHESGLVVVDVEVWQQAAGTARSEGATLKASSAAVTVNMGRGGRLCVRRAEELRRSSKSSAHHLPRPRSRHFRSRNRAPPPRGPA